LNQSVVRQTQSPFLLLVFLGVLGWVLAGQASAQTFRTLYDDFVPVSPPYTNNNGGVPELGLLSGNTLYGTTGIGGTNGGGTVFSLNSDGTGFTTLYSFLTNGGNGGHVFTSPQLSVLSGNTLYGTTTWGGSSDNGTVFAINTDGTGFTNLYSFTAPSTI